MIETHEITIAKQTGATPRQVEVVRALLDEGATIPFIARYRKEKTGSLDEVVLGRIRDELIRLAVLDKRRKSVMESLQEQNLLTEELIKSVTSAQTLTELEDIYLPYRPKRRTRATIAREKGLEPLANLMMAQEVVNPSQEALLFVNAEKGVASVEEALAGARDIIAERVNEDAEVRQSIRRLFYRDGVVQSTLVKGKESEASKYCNYFDWQEPVARMPGHRLLAMLRGENEGFLKLKIRPPEEKALPLLLRRFVKGTGSAAAQVGLAVEDSYARLLAPSVETDIRRQAKEQADDEALLVFSRNLRNTLMSPPLGSRAVLAVDPGYRTGCKVVCLDRQGKLLANDVIYLEQSEARTSEARKKIIDLVQIFHIEVIAIGNGTAGREAEEFFRGLVLPATIPIVMVNESEIGRAHV
jgi:protein Tex